MNWDWLDFAVFGGMIAAVGGIYWLTRRMTSNGAYRFAVGIALAGAFLLLWVNGAVGIIGDEGNDANLLFFGVLAVGIVGAALARFKAGGMVRALIGMAAAQVLVAIVALIAGWGSTAPIWPRDILFMTLFFSTFWLLSAWSFRRAALPGASQRS